jgi:hypothetical protein
MRKNKIIQENTSVVPVEKIFNIFNSEFIRTSVPAKEKGVLPDVKIIFPLNEYIDKVVFKPREFLSPKEAIIQRALLGLVKMKFDAFKGTDINSDGTPTTAEQRAEQFRQNEFLIYTAEIEAVLKIKGNIKREIHSAFRKLKEMDIDLVIPNGENDESECFGAIVNDLTHYKQRGYYTFLPSQLFQIMRKQEFREMDRFDAFHKITKEKNNELHYRQIHIEPSELLSLNRIQQAIMLYMLAYFEQSNGTKKEELFELNNNFYKGLFNTKEVSINQAWKFKRSLTGHHPQDGKEIIGLMEMEKYLGMFKFIGSHQLRVIFR